VAFVLATCAQVADAEGAPLGTLPYGLPILFCFLLRSFLLRYFLSWCVCLFALQSTSGINDFELLISIATATS
jgi:hypothetical protein